MKRLTDIIPETRGWPTPRANITMFPSSVLTGSLFIAVNETNPDADEDGDSKSAIYLTPDECETLGTALFRQAAWLRQNGE